jgi:hypothetical protein
VPDFVLHRQQHATDVDVADLMVVLDRLLGGKQAEVASVPALLNAMCRAP